MTQMIPTRLKQIVPLTVKNWLRPVVGKLVGWDKGAIRGRRPKTLSVEPTNKCNLNCPFCLVGLQNTLASADHDLLPRGFGFMDFKLYEKIVHDAAEFGITQMQIHFQGESLLHKRFPDMVKLAKEHGMYTQVFTNGLVLTEDYTGRIIESGLDLMRFSVDGASEETYQQNRVGGKFERVHKNMQMMVQRARAKDSPIRLVWQFIAFRNNEHEIEKARRMAQDIGIGFFVKTYAVTDPKLVPLNPRYQRSLHPKPCTDIYRAIFVYWNGDVVACCYDQTGENVVGNLGKNTLEEIWERPAYIELRRRIDNAYQDPDNEPNMCKTCLKWSHEPWKTSDGKTVWGQGRAPVEDTADVDIRTRMSAPSWLLDMRYSIWEWMLSLRNGEHPGQFRWCRTGSVIKPSHETGLGASALALKVGYQINRLAELETDELQRWVDYIRSFQTRPSNRYAGFFEDRMLLKVADRKAGWFKKGIGVRRAETRQACAALRAAGATPCFPILQIPRSPGEICQYLSQLPWKENPWGAGSHASHLMFFLKINADVFGRRDEYECLAPVVLEQLDALQDETTGSWFIGDPPISQKVNAAMKVLLIYDLIGMPFRWPEHLIDFCLTAATEDDACHNVDIIYVLHQCNRWTSHRQDDIQVFAERKLDAIRNHAKPDGAFSFFPDRTGTYYYGVRVSQGLPESDIHGTHLLVWATTLIADLLGFRDELGWKLPIT